MKKQTLFLFIICSLFLLSCSDDDDDDESSKIKQYDKHIVGIWVPVQNGDKAPSVFFFNKDKTGTMHTLKTVNNDIYYVSDTVIFRNTHFEEYEGTYGNVHTLKFQIYGDNGTMDWGIQVDYLDKDSLSTMYYGKYKKVASIQMK